MKINHCFNCLASSTKGTTQTIQRTRSTEIETKFPRSTIFSGEKNLRNASRPNRREKSFGVAAELERNKKNAKERTTKEDSIDENELMFKSREGRREKGKRLEIRQFVFLGENVPFRAN